MEIARDCSRLFEIVRHLVGTGQHDQMLGLRELIGEVDPRHRKTLVVTSALGGDGALERGAVLLVVPVNIPQRGVSTPQGIWKVREASTYAAAICLISSLSWAPTIRQTALSFTC